MRIPLSILIHFLYINLMSVNNLIKNASRLSEMLRDARSALPT